MPEDGAETERSACGSAAPPRGRATGCFTSMALLR